MRYCCCKFVKITERWGLCLRTHLPSAAEGFAPDSQSPTPITPQNPAIASHDEFLATRLSSLEFCSFMLDYYIAVLLIVSKINAAFTLNGFDDQERNLKFVKTDFNVLKLKFHACNFKQAFYPLHEL